MLGGATGSDSSTGRLFIESRSLGIDESDPNADPNGYQLSDTRAVK
jgi:hypothetical protein